MPEKANRALFERLISLGKDLAGEGQLNTGILKELARPERFPRFLEPVFRAFLRTRMAHAYFDNMLIDNNAFDKRFDQPYGD
jgi:hypothetical protein